MNSTLKRDLEATKSLIELPKNWTQGAMRRDRFGNDATKDKATCRCLMAAMFDAVGGRGSLEGRERVDAMEEAVKPYYSQCSIAMFNDDPKTTHGDVLTVLNKALAK